MDEGQPGKHTIHRQAFDHMMCEIMAVVLTCWA